MKYSFMQWVIALIKLDQNYFLKDPQYQPKIYKQLRKELDINES